jgi:hypothetical protein
VSYIDQKPEMPDDEVRMHFRAAKAAGEESACGTKLQHDTLASARQHADSLNKRKIVLSGERNECEPYPCPFCSPSTSVVVNRFYYHVGRKMTEDEREQFSHEPGYTRQDSTGGTK